MTIDLHVTGEPELSATHSPDPGTPTTPTVYVKSCCGVPREQACAHDLPAAAFEPGCGRFIVCRQASQWGA